MRVPFEELKAGADMRRICERAVNPAAIEEETVRRVEDGCRYQVARVRNPRRVAEGRPPLYEGPPELMTIIYPYGVAVAHAWHACVAYGNKQMKRNGVVNPCRALPRPFEHEAAERVARERAVTLAEETAARHAAAAEEAARENILPGEGWDELLAQEDTLALVH